MIQIVCINKDGGNHTNPHEGITNFGWVNSETSARGNSSRPAMVAWIENGGKAFVRDAAGNVAWLVVRTSAYGNKYVQTLADNRWTNNLLALQECRI